MLIKKFLINETHCNRQGRIKLSALQHFMQECAGEDFDSYGITGHEMRKNGMAFVLTRVAFDIFNEICVGDTVEIFTAHDHIEGISLIREFIITGQKGYCCRATTVWILLNLDTRRILRPAALEHYPPTLNLFKDQVEYEKRVFAKDDVLTPICDIEINAGYIDENGHVNNTYYQDFIAKVIEDRYCDRFLTHVQISYLHEIFEGETVKMFGIFEENAARIRATKGDAASFEAVLKFRSE